MRTALSFRRRPLPQAASRLAVERLLIVGILWICAAVAGWADEAGSLDLNFDPGSIDGPVRALVLGPDGQVFIGGDFTKVNGTERRGVARLNPDGSLDDRFHPGSGLQGATNLIVTTLALQNDGKLLVGGSFTNANGSARNLLARLNPTGTLDEAFDPALSNGPDGAFVSSISVQEEDGKVMVGGLFRVRNGSRLSPIARLSADGALDTSFAPPQFDGAYFTFCRCNGPGIIYSLALQPDGKVLVAGRFERVDGQLRFTVARLNRDGAFDARFAPQLALPGYEPIATVGSQPLVMTGAALRLQEDGRCLLAYNFPLGRTGPRSNIARINSNGTVDSSFSQSQGVAGNLSAMALDADGRAMVGGAFTTAGGVASTNTARVNAFGLFDPLFGSRLSMDGEVLAMAAQPDGTILVAGNFRKVNGRPRSGLARLNGDNRTGRAPVILKQPDSQKPQPGEPVFLRAIADGFPLSYQWQHNGANLPGATNDTVFLPSVTSDRDGSYRVTVANSSGSETSVPASVTVLDMPQVLDTKFLAWMTGGVPFGEILWTGQTNVTHDGTDAARSPDSPLPNGPIGMASSWLETSITGPGTLRFWWRITANEFGQAGALSFAVGRAERATRLAGGAWEQRTVPIPPSRQTLRWTYTSDNLRGRAFLDEVSFTPSAPQIAAVSLTTEGWLRLSFEGLSGRAYSLQSSIDLIFWSDLANISGDGSSALFEDRNARAVPARFYRLVQLP